MPVYPRVVRLTGGAHLATTSVIVALLACGGGDKSTGPSNVVNSVTVSPSSFTISVGDNSPLTATALDAHGAALGGKTPSWSTSASGVATVSSSGVVTGVGVGTATISATIDQKSGSATVTVQAPVANAITVSPLNPNMVEGDSLPFTATARDAHGNVITGKTISWSTSAASVATVSASGEVTAIAAGTAVITASADGQSGMSTVTVTAAPTLVLDAAASLTMPVSSTGARLTTGSGGITYRLVIPPGALAGTVMVTMTPLVLERHLPAGGAFVGGVKFGPTGTTFLKPITLTMVSHVAPAAGQAIVGYIADDAGAITELAPGAHTSDSLNMTLRHFSVGGWGQFAAGNVPLIPIPGSSGPTASFQSQIAVLDADPNATKNQYLAVYQQWYNTVVGPALSGAHDGPSFTTAAFDFSFWDSAVNTSDAEFHFQPTIAAGLTTQRQAGVAALPNVLVGAIAANNQTCATSKSLSDAENTFLLQDIAQQFSVNTSQNGLDAQTVVNGLCVKVMNTLANFPATPQPNQPAQLDLQYGLKFGQNPNLQNNLFKVTLTLTGTTTDGQQLLQTDTQGQLSGAVTPTGTTDFTAGMNTCIHPSVGYRLDEVCLTHNVTRQFGTTINADVVIGTQAGLLQTAGVSRINGNLIIGGGITSTDLSELTQLTTVTGALLISGATSLHNLSGLSHLRVVGGNLTLAGLTAVTDFGGLSSVPAVQTLTLSGMPQVTSLTAFHQMQYTGLNINNMGGLTTLSDLPDAPPIMFGGVQMSGNSHLFDASILHNVIEIDQEFQFFNNPLFTTLNDLAVLTKVTGDATLGGIGLTNGVLLPHLAHISRTLTIFVNELDGITSFDLPGLTDVGQSITLSQTRQSPGGPAGALLTVHFSALQSFDGTVSGNSSSNSKRLYNLSLPSVSATVNFGLGSLLGMRTFAAQTITSADFVEIAGNPDLVTLALGGVTTTRGASLEGNIEINGNDALATLTFTQAVHVAAYIEIDNNNALTAIQFAGGTTGNNMEIDHNPALTSIGGAFSLVGVDLFINTNANLSTAAATQWANSVSVGGQRLIFANKLP